MKQFDKDANGWLNQEERRAAREFQKKNPGSGRFGPPGAGPRGRFGGPGRGGESDEPPKPGARLTPSDVKSFPGAPLYAPEVLRTIFLQFENSDWEQELADFKNSDVEVPAKVAVDGRTYLEVGVHFHGMSSYMMVGEGQKRSLTLTFDFVHHDQHLEGYRKLDLLNAHEDPSFLHTVLAMQIARDYLPAPKANFVRVVINGESWGIYVNQEHFNKDLLRDAFGTTEGARWKVPGGPGGRGGLNYLGEDFGPYRGIYEIKSKDDPKSWTQLVNLCRVLNETPAEKLEAALGPILDVEHTLKFLAWENVLANGDGFYTRASDYSLYVDDRGRFHVIPYDANETFSFGGGPGGPGGPSGRGGPGGPGGRRPAGGFGPGMFIVPQMIEDGDGDQDQKLSRREFMSLAEKWYAKLDAMKAGHINRDRFLEGLGNVLPAPQRGGPGGPPGSAGPGGRGGFGPAMFIGPGLFTAMDADKNGEVDLTELRQVFDNWFVEWDTDKSGALGEEHLGRGINAALPRPEFGGPGGPFGGGGPGRGGPFGGGGVKLDPLVGTNDTSKPLLSKLLAVPSFRTSYLGYVREITEEWLDWNRLGPIVEKHRELIAADIKADTRKLDTFEEFENSLADAEKAPEGVRNHNLKSFAEQRRAFLLAHPDVAKQDR